MVEHSILFFCLFTAKTETTWSTIISTVKWNRWSGSAVFFTPTLEESRISLRSPKKKQKKKTKKNEIKQRIVSRKEEWIPAVMLEPEGFSSVPRKTPPAKDARDALDDARSLLALAGDSREEILEIPGSRVPWSGCSNVAGQRFQGCRTL